MENEAALHTAVRAVSSSVGRKGLVHFENFQFPSPTRLSTKTAGLLLKPTNKVSKFFAPRQVRYDPRSCNWPNVTIVHTTPIGAPVLLYRKENNVWNRLY